MLEGYGDCQAAEQEQGRRQVIKGESRVEEGGARIDKGKKKNKQV